MTARSVMIALFFGAGALSASALSGCGKTGELEQPAPLYGAQAKADYQAKKKAEAEERARQEAARKAQPAPPSVVEDPTNTPLTQAPYSAPLPSTANPRAGQPASTLGNPGSSPHQ
jgi:hypothetical protein